MEEIKDDLGWGDDQTGKNIFDLELKQADAGRGQTFIVSVGQWISQSVSG